MVNDIPPSLSILHPQTSNSTFFTSCLIFSWGRQVTCTTILRDTLFALCMIELYRVSFMSSLSRLRSSGAECRESF